MSQTAKAPLLSRVKSWQLIGLGISGWCTFYSIALLTWGTSSTLIGNTQGGCFAATMTLAGVEARRYKRGGFTPVDPLQWTGAVPTEHLNQTLAQVLQTKTFRVEPCQPIEIELGFGVRGVNAGRTIVFETGRWKEPVIDLPHVQSTEENRKKVFADVAFIVGAGKPDEAAETFVKTRPLDFLVGQELKDMLHADRPQIKKV